MQKITSIKNIKVFEDKDGFEYELQMFDENHNRVYLKPGEEYIGPDNKVYVFNSL